MEATEYLDTSSNPQPLPAQQPAQMRATGVLTIRNVEETRAEAFMTSKVDNPETKRIQMAEQMRSSKR